MKNLINVYNEKVANDEKFNKAIIYGSIVVQGISTVLIITASYFAGMRKGVDITDDYYEREKSHEEK